MDYYLWVVRGSGRLLLVDTGFNMDMAVKRNRTLLRTPAERLKLLGIDMAEVRQIVITHFHNDHVGSFDGFPNAEFHVQDDEMAFATGRHMRYERFNRAYEPDHVAGLGDAGVLLGRQLAGGEHAEDEDQHQGADSGDLRVCASARLRVCLHGAPPRNPTSRCSSCATSASDTVSTGVRGYRAGNAQAVTCLKPEATPTLSVDDCGPPPRPEPAVVPPTSTMFAAGTPVPRSMSTKLAPSLAKCLLRVKATIAVPSPAGARRVADTRAAHAARAPAKGAATSRPDGP
jgi:hypothetical protein